MKLFNFYIRFIILCNFSPFLVPGCYDATLVGNGFCNDETNNANCNYDGGECCVMNASTDYCSECACHFLETCLAGYHLLVGNGICDDETNIADCNYDDGDCCGNNINSDHCTICACFIQETCAAGVHPLVSDGFCNDETNNFDCDYDGGDCCLNVNWNYCSECSCLGGVITSPGFPGNYDNNLDLTWLIQVQMGQRIEINFLSFDVESHSNCK